MSHHGSAVLWALATTVLVVAGCAGDSDTGFVPGESSTGYLEVRETGGPRTYSFRSDPESEFIIMRWHGGGAWRRNKTIVFSDGRYVHTYYTYQGEPREIYETKLTVEEKAMLLNLIVDFGLMNHDHRKAMVAERRNPMEGRRFINCSDCSSISLKWDCPSSSE